ncbi:hypothetical protein SAMN02745136_01339 [Anaerocolumna jejuensis DSM 15929]|uniref:DUF1653 domain-containing protein n=1 Tax=Anaerocolumna jejuensis DSM 15929 TaxID=1121322 RepID=A0A1M6NKC5_9FIRM|nr:hypothetical protein [Anaerocolumna jejuensis]SHJ96150.1 hypothetical protein SAMN02745136_01339 [Anaerocolumna jejuensis DSM 15929]
MGERTLPAAGQLFLDNEKKLVQFIAIAIYKRMEGEIAVYQALSGDYKIYAMPYADFIMEMVPYTPQKEIPFMEASRPADEAGNSFIRPNSVEAAEPVERGGGDGGSREESEAVNPVLLAFLDADTFEEKLNILTGSRKYLDDRLLTHMAISVDCVIGEGDAEEKINNLIFCLKTRARFESNRLR